MLEGVELARAGARAGRRARSGSTSRPTWRRSSRRRRRRSATRARARHRRQPDLRRDARGQRADLRRLAGGGARDRRGPGRPGGQHRRRAAPRDAPTAPSGFCVYNDCAVAISWLLDHGFERIAYVDVDVHHGDGVQAAFYDDPRVLTISLHQHPLTLWPGTGWPRRVRRRARPRATRSTWRCRPAPRRGLAARLPRGRAVAARGVPAAGAGHPVRRRHPPRGPAGRPGLSVDGHRDDLPGAARARRATPPRAAGSPLGGGGYALFRVVPRAWTHLLATVLDRDVDPATPRSRRAGRRTPPRLTGRRAAHRR